MALTELPLPNRSHIERKVADIVDAKFHNYQEDDIEAVSLIFSIITALC